MTRLIYSAAAGFIALTISACGGSSSDSGGGAYSSPPASSASAAPMDDAKVPGTDYHATGNVPCSMGGGAPAGYCAFGVTREGGGSGIVTVTKADGRTRSIFFENGSATGYDMSQADPGEFRAEKQADMNIITIGEERYEIPDAVIFGG